MAIENLWLSLIERLQLKIVCLSRRGPRRKGRPRPAHDFAQVSAPCNYSAPWSSPHLHTSSMSSQQSDVVSLWKPSIARHEFRTNPALKGVTTAGFCMGYLQTTVVILPSALANDFEQFCEFNSVACPLLYRSERGEVSAGPLAPASDIRYKTKWNL